MTPQEKELILSVANKLKQSPNNKKDSEAEAVINTEIASQPDAIYKLTQAVLVQEMALKNLKEQNEYLQKNSEYYKEQNNRGTFSRMFGGSQAAPQPPQPPVRQPSAFGGFMQTAAGVAAGMVAGHLISDMLFDNKDTATPEETVVVDDNNQNTAPDNADAAQQDTAQNSDTSSNDNDFENPAFDDNSNGGSFLDDTANNSFSGGFGDSGFSDSGFGSDTGFGGDNGFTDNSGFGDDDTFANNGFGGGDDSFFGGDDSGFGDDDDTF
ncbi:DUF2076 family protein [Photobacterium damselae]|uniref:DUF2076 family protein n=1 Tax=Photobacterium damselae TaxID=38293 RepID=UPI000DFD1560|nr:DUF2076 family protein [Photobacterium damselae]EHA1080458.1 DUF2076 domain-containing protein [Photobacterium damselae]MCG3815699.1 DUF2076 family protein [Photobacterium damselae]SUB90365.1 Uncharacterized protein conserved in bacteria (DUF2076) [Photobacterium damselae]